ncbi:MAG: hypothetical protein J6B22_05295 [Clostridia bacterium]|nr:hypothetical protein [Clostridia bacterium]
MNNSEFERQRQNAVKEMREMNSKSTNTPPKKTIPPPPQRNFLFRNNINLPFENLFKDKETALILGLLLILYGEKADRLLLLALVYILL